MTLRGCVVETSLGLMIPGDKKILYFTGGGIYMLKLRRKYKKRIVNEVIKRANRKKGKTGKLRRQEYRPQDESNCKNNKSHINYNGQVNNV